MIKYIKYLLVFLLATGFVACSEDEGAQILGGLYEKVDITPEPGMNLVGRVTDGTGPIEGVVVSDGVTVTTTDAQGIYQMRVKRNAPFVFVSVPAEYEIPVENGMPKIYKKIAMGDNDVVQRSFKLERTGKKERFTLLALADVQIGRDDEVTMLDEEVLPLLIPYVQQELEAPVYGISLGDLVWDNMPFHEVYKQRIRKIGVPVFQVIGNHDHNKAITVDADADASFEAAFGPTYYSYNIGDCHFIVLDDVLYTGSSSYTADITDEQMAWLEQDLKYVPKDKLIIIGLHIATSRRNRPTSHVADYKELYALLDGYNVRILSGHSHNNYTTTISETIEENTLGAVMGAYWNGEELCNDGSPRGYAVYEIEGNRIRNWYYKGTAFPREYQMYLYGPGEAVSEKYRDGLILNIFNWHTTWTVEVQEDNAGWVTLPSDSNLRYEMDRRAYDFMFGDTKPEHRPTAEPESNNDHMFYYKPASESWGTVTVRASDPYGNVYRASATNRPYMKTRFSALPVPTVRRIFQPYPDHETSFSDFSALPVRRVFRRRTAFGQPARFRREPPDAHYPDAVPTRIRTRRQIHRRPYLFRLRPGQPAPRVGVQGAGAGREPLRDLHLGPAHRLRTRRIPVRAA